MASFYLKYRVFKGMRVSCTTTLKVFQSDMSRHVRSKETPPLHVTDHYRSNETDPMSWTLPSNENGTWETMKEV